MTGKNLATLARALVADHKGLLAIDESVETCNTRFAAFGIPPNAEMRRDWRELLVTTPGLGTSISGVILFDETIRQLGADGRSFVRMLADAGIVSGIKVDTGITDLAGHPGETITNGLRGLAPRLAEYASMGARFAKWRAVFAISGDRPSPGCIDANADALARYAVACQQHGLVPIVEPEVLMEGFHPIARCADVTEAVLNAVFRHCHDRGVALDAMILKPNMVMAGTEWPLQSGVGDAAAATMRVLSRAVPVAVPGIAFLSGGQTADLATARLNAMNQRSGTSAPWQLSFSYGRAIQQPALAIWRGQSAQVAAAQSAVAHRAALNRTACAGRYDVTMESGADSETRSLALVH
ncbi:class I fructose-bisphosphate aldolase [Sphingomonas sp. IW22]|uniref:class I fructose-bisphosphate aldolase n=1 Tax=Sphingomonas sp. IW22 TaxID=3242489 RepID=UPI0035220C22